MTAARENPALDWSEVRRVLLVRLRSIGDTVLMTPCLSALKSFRPDAKVAVLMEPLSAPVLEDHPLVDDLLIVRPGAAKRARLSVKLRPMRFDVAFNMHGGTTGAILAAVSGAKSTIGYRDYGFSWMLDKRAPSPDQILGREGLHSVDQQLALLNWSGVPLPQTKPKLSLTVSDAARQSVRARLAQLGIDISAEEKRFAVLAPAAAMESKRWPAEGFASVADQLSKDWNLPSVIIAGPGQENIALDVAQLARSPAKPLTGIGLKELIALLELSGLFIGNDSGPMHIAAALARPVVALFGSSNATVWHPWTDSPYRILQAEDGIRQIRANDVIASVEEVIRENDA